VDLHFVREARRVLGPGSDGSGPGQLDPDYARDLTRELNTYTAADAVIAVSDKEAAFINDITGQPALAYSVPDCEDLDMSTVPFHDRRGILFLGNFRHQPNRDAAHYLFAEMVPRLDPGLLAQHEFWVVGNALDEEVRAFAGDLQHIRMIGWVPSVLPYLQQARLSVICLRYGAGTKRKLVQGLMVGTPTVSTTVGIEGLGLVDGEQVLVADSPAAFADGVRRLLTERRLWNRIARNGREHIMRSHSREAASARLRTLLQAVEGLQPRTAVTELNLRLRTRSDPAYERLITRVREVIEAELPQGSVALVVSRGDDRFLKVRARRAWHFPQTEDGEFSGFYPEDSEAAIGHLEELRHRGASHLVFPNTAFWWLGYYKEFQEHLDRNYRRFWRGNQLIIYELRGGGEPTKRAGPQAKVTDRPARIDRKPTVPAMPSAPAVPDRVTEHMIERLRPQVPVVAADRAAAAGPFRALVLGVYLADKPTTIEHIVPALRDSERVETHQRWVALGGEPPTETVAAVTAAAVRHRTSKYRLMNQLLRAEDLARYDFVLNVDDDVVLPERFLERFLGLQSQLDFVIAQPARTANSHVDHPIVVQQRGVLARRTLFVEIGPIVSFHRDAYDAVFPFDEENAMGWGFENVWAHRLQERGHQMGIIDAVPVDHSIRKPVAHYSWDEAVAHRTRYLREKPHLPMADCFRVLEVAGLEE
jgi:hypothetical protein